MVDEAEEKIIRSIQLIVAEGEEELAATNRLKERIDQYYHSASHQAFEKKR